MYGMFCESFCGLFCDFCGFCERKKCIQLTESTEYTEECTECFANLSVVYSVASVRKKLIDNPDQTNLVFQEVGVKVNEHADFFITKPEVC